MTVTQSAQDALVEEYIEGRKITVALLGNAEIEVSPLVEQNFGDRETRLMTWEAKHVAVAAPRRICLAQIGNSLKGGAEGHFGCGLPCLPLPHYASVDLRIDRSGQPLSWRSTTIRHSIWASYVVARGPPDTASQGWSTAFSTPPTHGITEPAFCKLTRAELEPCFRFGRRGNLRDRL
ncbi:hypothetical protein [Mesorhizobium sp. M0965]